MTASFLISRLGPQPKTRESFFKFSVFVLTFLVYMAFHSARKSISVVKNAKAFLDCEAPLNDTEDIITCASWFTEMDDKPEAEAKTWVGFVDTSFLVSYSFFMFFSGVVAERVNLRYFMVGGMLFSAGLTVLLGFSYTFEIHSIWYLLVLQVFNGMFHSTGWPGVVAGMGNWFGKGQRGLIMGIWNSHTSIGNIVGSTIAGAFVTYNWGLSFIVPGIVLAAVGLLCFFAFVPHPSNIGISSDDEENPKEQTEDKPVTEDSSSAIGFIGAFKIPGVIEFSLCLFFAKLVSYTFLYWLPNYIHSKSGVDADDAAFLSTIFDYGGILGGILAGVMTDKTGMSATTCSVMLVFAIPLMFIYQSLVESMCPLQVDFGVPIVNNCYYWNAVLLFATGLLVNGPYSLITTAVSAELGQHPSLKGSHKALATVSAIIDGTGSIGAAVGPLLAGPLSGNNHWENVFYMLMASDVMALLLLGRLVKNEISRVRNRKN